MTASDDSSSSSAMPSVATRLRLRYGVDIDPRVELPTGTVLVQGGTTTAAAPATAVLHRLVARGDPASRYRLQGEIARGGMGAILEVVDEDLRRNLAMKVILDADTSTERAPSGTVDPKRLARFLEEAQITGQLDHPGIVPVHELGLDAQGQVYFTMRLVRGRDLSQIFGLVRTRSESWTMPRAVSALLKVCEAMAFAHDKGVVHRDLKPANVMVGQFGELYVMDWGLARVRDRADSHDIRIRRDVEGPAALVQTDRANKSSATDNDALRTMDGDVMGTPAYMAPEQARGEIDRLDERADVYALGAMLYELLAQTPPYIARGEQVGAAIVWQRVIAGPPDALESSAPGAPHELVAICEKAMAREPRDRYANMLALADDLRAFLEGRVVSAFETGAWAEARKWVRRNKSLAASLAAGILALVGGLVMSVWLGERARESAALAETRRQEASTSAALAESRRTAAEASAEIARREGRIAAEANAFLNDDLLASVAPGERGIDVTVRDVLDEASERLNKRFANEPAIESALRMTIGMSYEKLGEFEPARVNFERALELRRATDGDRAESTLQAMRQVAGVWSELGRRDEAITLCQEVIGIARELLGPENRATLSTRIDLGLMLSRGGDFAAAREIYLAVLPIESRVLGPDHADTLTTMLNLASLDQRQGHLDEALRGFEHVFERRLDTLGDRDPSTLEVMSSLALAQADLGRFDESETLSRNALALHREIYGRNHPQTGRTLGNLGALLVQRGRPTEAEPLLIEALRIAREHHGEMTQQSLQWQTNLAEAVGDLGRIQEAFDLRRDALDAQTRVLGPEHPDTLRSMNNLASTYRALNQLDEAETLFRETLALQRKVLGPDHPSTIVTNENLGGVLFSRRDYEASEAVVREVLAARVRVLGDEHPDVAKTTFNLAMITKSKGDTGAALTLFEEALRRRRSAGAEAHPLTAECLRQIGDIRAKSMEHAAATEVYVEALGMRRELGPDDELTGYLLHQLGVSHFVLNEFPSALVSFEEANRLRERLLGRDAPATRITLYMVAHTLVKLDRFSDAEPIALDFHERTARLERADHDHAARAKKLLFDLYTGWGRAEDAAKWR